jgi:hypothetical protein
MGDHTSEAGHWYKPDGTPAYTYINKKGEEKNTTLRKVRKEGWFPSVTGIIDCQMKWGLVNWKIEQNIMSALTITRNSGETEVDFVARIKEDAQAQAKKAAEKGTEIHAIVQEGFEGKELYYSDPYFLSAQSTIDNECGKQKWVCEKPFASPLGYGGKVDLQTDEFIIDIKTTDKDIMNPKFQTWPDHAQQLAAYADGITEDRKCGILFINVNTAESRLIWITEEGLEQGWECFKALLAFWKAKNRV